MEYQYKITFNNQKQKNKAWHQLTNVTKFDQYYIIKKITQSCLVLKNMDKAQTNLWIVPIDLCRFNLNANLIQQTNLTNEQAAQQFNWKIKLKKDLIIHFKQQKDDYYYYNFIINNYNLAPEIQLRHIDKNLKHVQITKSSQTLNQIKFNCKNPINNLEFKIIENWCQLYNGHIKSITNINEIF